MDVDGVLNSLPYFQSLDQEDKKANYTEISDFHLQKLAQIYHTCDAHIVLSSSWRNLDNESDMNVHPMYQYLVESLAKYDMKIISKTPVIHMNRPLEIFTWLNRREDKQDIRFVILDDDFTKRDYNRYGIGDYLVHTRFFCNEESKGGLQKEHVDKAVKILKG